MLDNIRRLLIRAQAVAGHQGVLDSALGMPIEAMRFIGLKQFIPGTAVSFMVQR